MDGRKKRVATHNFRVLYIAIKKIGTASRRLKVYDKKCCIYGLYKRFGDIKYANLTPIDRLALMNAMLHDIEGKIYLCDTLLELPTTLMDISKLDNTMAQMLMETVNNMLIELYAAMAPAEIEKKEKRQREGIEAKKARGDWDDYGRPSSVDIEDFKIHYQKVIDGQIRPTELMKHLGISKITYYHYVDQITKM